MTIKEIREKYNYSSENLRELVDYLHIIELELIQTKQQNENLKCCGNCERESKCDWSYSYQMSCNKWQSDNITKNDRRV